MKEIKSTNRFLRDLKLARKRGKDPRQERARLPARCLKLARKRGKALGKVEAVVDALARGTKLAPRHRPHMLQGNMKGLRECHVEPD